MKDVYAFLFHLESLAAFYGGTKRISKEQDPQPWFSPRGSRVLVLTKQLFSFLQFMNKVYF